jgi:hypothetical protein
MADDPPLTEQAQSHALEVRTRFEENLRKIAIRLAINNRAENVLVPDIDEALRALKRSGLEPTPKWFFQRRDFKIAAGFTAVGLSPSIAGLVYSILAANCPTGKGVIESFPGVFWGLNAFLPVAVCVAGLAYAINGWNSDHR